MNGGYSFFVDSRLRIGSWSEEIAGLAGTPASAVLGKKYNTVFPRIITGEKDALSEALARQRKISLKGHVFRCPGSHVTADIRIEPVRAASKVKGLNIVLENVSPCPLVKSRNGLLGATELRKNTSALAHGVRNPLNAIKGAVAYIAGKYSKEPILSEFVKIMQEETTRLDNFISSLLVTSEHREGSSLIEINSLLRRIEKFTRLQTVTNNIRPVYEYGEVQHIMADFFQIDQAILNVINNAIEAMPSGGELMVKSGSGSMEDIAFVFIEIGDTGPGLDVCKIGEYSGNSREKGKGFGLGITREILQRYGGYMEIESKKDKGTLVRLLFPIQRSGGVE
jgi:two-component system, NtrC family, nitrogen regulation sensor histidine kinase GlnL